MPRYLLPSDIRRKLIVTANKMLRVKIPEDADAQPEGTAQLRKCLTTFDLTSLGVGSCCGTGMYVVAGMVAKDMAGPGVVFSFMIAAVASLLSGICYAEFGVRVPHTSGSAYMYSYVTVGEFIAFVIGWTMVMEYLIGTSACAAALSACFDAIANYSISNYFRKHLGSVFGRPPDIIGFFISLSMMVLLIAGVKKSALFNNVLNTINFCIWIFIMIAGCFYIDGKNWTKDGFLPFGSPGVFTGAATCFYAFIGFDIIATTGEEANNARKSIPIAIISSLVITTIAYITSSMMITLIVPYDKVESTSALVQMFAYQGSSSGKYIVSIGALAGLTVSMFGSMFPMPRIIYAMAKDGLIFRELSQVWNLTGTPALATVIFGSLASFAALLIRLEILVEMMSIGTLLAYTLVSTCVLILRYQPEKTSLIELIPVDNAEVDAVSLRSDGEISMTGYEKADHDFYHKDDEYLIPDDNPKSYGSLPSHQTDESRMNFYEKYMRLCNYYFLFPFNPDEEVTEKSGKIVIRLVGLMYLFIVAFDIIVVTAMPALEQGYAAVWVFLILFFICILVCIFMISKRPQNRKTLKFMAPGLPLLPSIAILVNVYLIFKLSILTLARFVTWMIIGGAIYFTYGIKNSSLECLQEESLPAAGGNIKSNTGIIIGEGVSVIREPPITSSSGFERFE